ncbi:MAG TPA: hypothetical protein VHP30_08345 [Ignavibacteriales bacterium]|nr:hypothetical protein [Ignavibacteriales bacterium]
MKLRKDKILYSRNVKAGIICSLLVMIALFYFFPDIESGYKVIRQYEFAIAISDVPSTRQEASGNPAPSTPALPSITLPEDGLETVLQDIDIPSGESFAGNGSSTGTSGGSSMGSSGKGDSQFSSGTYIPRQILEVFPEKTTNKHTGQVLLSLRIGADGKVISHRIVQNTTGSEECLANSIKAAYKSKWNPVNNGNALEEYWVEKKYEFR